MLLRRIILTAAVALFALPALASAEPAITAPTPGYLQTKAPLFTWTNNADEDMQSISISTSPVTDSDGSVGTTGGTFLYPLSGLTSGQGSTILPAGTYYWNASWKNPSSSTYHETAVQSFTIPGFISAFRGSIKQYGSISAINVAGQYVTNGSTAVLTCKVLFGKHRIDGQKVVRTYVSIARLNKFYCDEIDIPERYDGRRLKLVVTLVSAGKTAVAVKYFRAV